MSELADYTQDLRSLQIDTVLPPDTLLLTAVEGEEALSRIFLYKIDFYTKAPDTEVGGLIGNPATLWLNNDNETARQPVSGYIRRVIGIGNNSYGLRGYRVELVPRLWFMDCTTDCRIFQNLTYPEIIHQMLEEYGVSDYQMKLMKPDYPVAEYCVQYRETALNFVCRLMEEVGIFFYHEHSAEKHTLMIVDSNTFTLPPPAERFVVSPGDRDAEISSLQTDTIFRPGAWALKDYDFKGPTKQMHKQSAMHSQSGTEDVSMMLRHERFDFPGGYTDQDVGEWLTDLRMQAEEALHSRMLGTARMPVLLAGGRFQLDTEQYGVGDPALTYLTIEIRHHALDNSHFSEAGDQRIEYHEEFVAINAKVPFRPLLHTPKSKVAGLQTATVVAPSPSDPIQVDQYGRVKIFFHWDRRGNPAGGATSCWVRVSQNSAGGGFGGISVPHAGQEVVVDFLEGDPDRPLIIGRVHNADKTASTNLPSDKHKTITRDHGNNKFVLHGKTGTQHVSMISPGSLNMFAMSAAASSLSSAASGSSGNSWPTIANNPAPTGYTNIQAAVDLANSDSAAYSQGTIGMDSNSVTEDDTNTFSYNDNNTWAMGNQNVYVQKCRVSWVQQNTTATVVGNTMLTVSGDVKETITGKVVRTVGGSVTDQISGHRLVLVHQNDTLGVDADVKVDVTGKYVRTVGGNLTDQVTGHRLATIAQNDTVGVDGKLNFDVSGDVTMTSASGAVNITAATQISLTVGGNSIVISTSGITINGAGPVAVTAPAINLNS